MYRSEVISYPRSGYHLIKRLVSRYFAKEFNATTVYSNPSNNIYNNPTITFQKNHDLPLTTKTTNDKDVRYLVIIRYPLESLVSYYKFQSERSGIEHSRSGWEYFALSKIDYWIKFYDKWVVSKIENRCVLNYGSLMLDPYTELGKVIRFLLESDREVDNEKISCIVDPSKGGGEIKRKNNICNFEYYDEKFFNDLRNKIKSIPSINVENDTLS